MSDDDIIERGGTQEDIDAYAHDVGGACGAAYGGSCDYCGKVTPINSEYKPTDSDYVALWQLQDIEETIQDASPEEMPELYDKLEALSSGLTEAIQKLITADRKRVELEARIDENNMYIRELTRHYFPSGPNEPYIPLVQFHERIYELKAQQEEV